VCLLEGQETCELDLASTGDGIGDDALERGKDLADGTC
jgi:hypothetical protein